MAPVKNNKRQASPPKGPGGKRQVKVKEAQLCPNCETYVGKKNTVRCDGCEQLVHILCTELTIDDVVSQTGNFTGFKCNACDHARDITSDPDMETDGGVLPGALDERSLLLGLVKEIRLLRATVERLEATNSKLERDVRDLTGVIEASKTKRGRQGERASRSRSRVGSSRSTSTSCVGFASSRHRSDNQAAAKAVHVSTRPPVRRAANNARFKNKQLRRVLNVGDSTTAISSAGEPAGAEAAVMHASISQQKQPRAVSQQAPLLPAARANFRTSQIFVSRLDYNVTAAQVHAHLKQSDISVFKVRKIRPRFPSHSSFIIDVPEIEAAKVFNEALWSKGTLVMDYRSKRGPVDILEYFPAA